MRANLPAALRRERAGTDGSQGIRVSGLRIYGLGFWDSGVRVYR